MWGLPSFGAVGLLVVVLAGVALASPHGTAGADRLRGTNGPDVLKGRSGADRLSGRGGADVLRGGPGRDVLVGGPGRDGFNMRRGRELAAPGRDLIRARDGRADEVSCGAGRDKAILDAEEDGVYGCEVVIVP